jgi:predicted PurR-regulated permease PerM
MNHAAQPPEESHLPTTPPIPTEQTRTVVRGAILFTIAVLLALALAWSLREVLALIYVSALFAVVFTPLVNNIMGIRLRGNRHISRLLAIVLLLGCIFFAVALFFLIALPPVIRDLHQFAYDLPARIPAIVARLKRLPLADKLGVDNIAQRSEDALSATAAYLFSSFPNWMGRIFDLLTAFVLCIYFMLEGEHAYDWMLSLFPRERRQRLDTTLRAAELRVSKWLFGQATLMLILGVTSTLVFGLLHVRYFILLGVLMGLFNVIPIAGAVITVTLSALVAALDSWEKMLGVLIFYIIYVNIENAVLTPRIMRHSVNLMGLTVLIALIAGAKLAGIAGILVAVPTAALISVFLDEYLVQKDLS